MQPSEAAARRSALLPLLLPLLLLPRWAAAAAAQGARARASPVFNPMMGSWRSAPATFDDPKLGTVRTVNVSEVAGMAQVGASLVHLAMRGCTAQAPNWHPNADEFVYALKGDGMLQNVIYNGSLYTSSLREGDLHVVPQGLIHSRVNPTCDDLELLILFNAEAAVVEKAVPALLALPPSKAFMEDGGFGAFLDANPTPPTAAIYPLGGGCSQRCADKADAADTSGTAGKAGGYDRFTASLSGAPAAAQDEHGSHRLLTAAQLPALGDVRQPGASFSFTTVRNCSFPSPHFMPHANKLTMPVAGAVNVSVLVNGSQLYSHELGHTGDFFVLPKADLFSLTNGLCRDAHIVAYWDAPDAAKTYPLAELRLLPEQQLAGAFGVEGAPQLEEPAGGAFWPFDQPACCSRAG